MNHVITKEQMSFIVRQQIACSTYENKSLIFEYDIANNQVMYTVISSTGANYFTNIDLAIDAYNRIYK